jgi:hypothetical protein
VPRPGRAPAPSTACANTPKETPPRSFSTPGSESPSPRCRTPDAPPPGRPTDATRRTGSGLPPRQNALEPGFHDVPAGPAQPRQHRLPHQPHQPQSPAARTTVLAPGRGSSREPRRCHIVVHRTTAMSHRCGCHGTPQAAGPGHRGSKFPLSGVQRHPITVAVTAVASDAGTATGQGLADASLASEGTAKTWVSVNSCSPCRPDQVWSARATASASLL